MREQACKYGAKIETEFVTKLERDEQTRPVHRDLGFGLRDGASVLIATGVTNRRPPMDEELHDDALARGLVRYCPICDGYEVTDKRVGVIGSDSHGVAEALFIRSYTADVTLIAPDKALRSSPRTSSKLKDAGIDCVDGPAQAVAISERLHRRRHSGGTLHVRQHLSRAGLGHAHPARRDGRREACPATAASWSTAHQRTSVPGLYAAGDVVIGLDQISHAMGEGGVAATTIRNDLCVEAAAVARTASRNRRSRERRARRGTRGRARSGLPQGPRCRR